jgi:UDP-N-acetylglucosamine:LPS N-acetylglucosamine transferase
MHSAKQSKRILLVSSSGGVLLDLLALQPWWSRYHTVWATVRAADTVSVLVDQQVRWVRETSIKRPLGILPGFVQAWRILRGERLELVVSAGSGVAISFFIVARALGIPTFWVSTLNLLTTPGISAKICARLASRVLLQQQSMLGAHANGIVIGELY